MLVLRSVRDEYAQGVYTITVHYRTGTTPANRGDERFERIKFTFGIKGMLESIWHCLPKKRKSNNINPLSAGIFTVFGLGLLEGRVLHKGAWVATLLGTLTGVQDYKNVKIPEQKYISCYPY